MFVKFLDVKTNPRGEMRKPEPASALALLRPARALAGAPLPGLCVLALALVSCAAASRQTFDLSAGAPLPPGARRLHEGTAAVVVEVPKASELVDSDRLVLRDASGAMSYLADAQWSDLAPRLVQARLIAQLGSSGVDAAYPGAVATRRLATALRRFEIDTGRQIAVVEIAARLSSEQSGTLRGAAIFVGEAPAPHTLPTDAAHSLDAALGDAAAQVAAWARPMLRGG